MSGVAFSRFDINSSSNTDRGCAICRVEMNDSDELLAHKCSTRTEEAVYHIFHEGCLKRSLEYSCRCPICWGEVTSLNGEGVSPYTFLSESARGNRVRVAASQGNLVEVCALLDEGAIISDSDRSLAIMAAASKGLLAIVVELIGNRQDSASNRILALKQAASKGHLIVIRELLSNGDTLSANNLEEISKIAMENDHPDILELLFAEAEEDFVDLTNPEPTSQVY